MGSASIVFSSMSDYNSARSSGINEIIIGTSDSKSKLTNANMKNEAIQGYFSVSPVQINSIEWYTDLDESIALQKFTDIPDGALTIIH